MRLAPLLLGIACTTTVPDQVTYTEHVQPILERHCVRCHAEGGVMYAGVGLESYSNARSTRVRSVCTAVDDVVVHSNYGHLISHATPEGKACDGWVVGSMPPGAKFRLSQTEMAVLARWVSLGAPE